jgi:hypothetical protein
MLPFHTLGFALCSIMVDPHLVPSCNASQKSVTFIMTVVQQAFADFHMVVLVPSCELLWNPSCRKFMKPKSILDDSMNKTITADDAIH